MISRNFAAGAGLSRRLGRAPNQRERLRVWLVLVVTRLGIRALRETGGAAPPPGLPIRAAFVTEAGIAALARLLASGRTPALSAGFLSFMAGVRRGARARRRRRGVSG